MRATRRLVLGLAAAPFAARAQSDRYPDRPIRLVVPFAPGGPTDVMARVISSGLTAALGQPVVVENRGGGGGNIGAAHVARSAPDGYSLLVCSTGFVVNPSLFRNPGYDPVRDFAPVTELGASPNVILAGARSGIGSIAELIARAKTTAGGLDMANPGTGSTPHLTAELLRLRAGIEFVQITHASAALAVQAVLGGVTPVGVAALPAAQPHILSGALKALAITSAERWPDLPDVPTMQELGFGGFVSETFQALLAPAGTPAPVILRLARESLAALGDAGTAAKLRAAGFGIQARGPEALATRIAREVPMWRDLIRQAGIPQE
ncbi:tripartite tricarboxylate transporter substrate binding protein [Belnapia sp. T6]|uniref:Tripartite tricarboxylate transporter substrate binding protein n=1 Tax=Belnapia mucosa TaxID=2804532 RepID=A0ABS1UWA3_9PROT|nr:tripartite tricarboxylate transporter substrate-binding protein [Belnapia mucosa]MBL6453746.1 tripartite tricarboxylate transporter substrate binding protein [Belnapia mucosa]